MEHTVVIERKDMDRIEVKLDGKPLTPDRSLKVRNHSPTGFNAGYAGSGPAQLALAILLKVLPKEQAMRLYQAFKFRYVAKSQYLELGVHEFKFDDDMVIEEGA